MTVVKRYEHRPNPVEVVEVKSLEDISDPEFAEFVDHLFRYDADNHSVLIYDVEERTWEEDLIPCTVAKFKDGSLKLIAPGFLSDYKEIVGSKPVMPPIAEFTAVVKEYVDRKCCCCGGWAGTNGYCGPNGCYDRPA